jgi:hypothetical protein
VTGTRGAELGDTVRPRVRTDRRRLIAIPLVAGGLVALGAGAWVATSGSREPQLRGVVIGVESRDLGHAAAITIQTAEGRQQRFLVDPSVDPHWTPGHLRDHMLLAEPITVFYRQAGSDLAAYRITD